MDETEQWLRRKAQGFHYEESVEEFADTDGELRLVRKKVSRRYLPPDVTAIKTLREEQQGTLSEVSNAELMALRDKLIKERRKERARAKIKSKEEV